MDNQTAQLDIVDEIVVLKRQLDHCREGDKWPAKDRDTAILSCNGIINACDRGLALDPQSTYFPERKREAEQTLAQIESIRPGRKPK